MAVRSVEDDNQFQAELAAAGIQLVVADFSASWCGPCRLIGPLFDQLPSKYPKAIFLKVDVDKCQDTAAAQGVSVMPTFIFYRNRAKIDRMQGADITALEAKIVEHLGSGSDDTAEDYGQGLMDINTFIAKKQCECLNESDEYTMQRCLESKNDVLQSDCDAQLILSVTFNQVVKIHSFKIHAPPQSGPKEIKIFINQPRTIDFDMAESCSSVQDIILTPKDLEGNPVKLRYVKFQNVQNIQIYVRNNQDGSDMTQINNITFIGSPLLTTKMSEFKRVIGKKGESH